MPSRRSGLGPLRARPALAALLAAAAALAACKPANGGPAAPAKPAPSPTAGLDPRDRDARLPPLAQGTVILDTPRGTWVIDVEVARSPEERARGLMWRRDLAADHGMLFVFAEEQVQSFWMHNTLIALDMIHLGSDRAVAGVVAHAEPRTDTPRSIGKPSRYVLEVGAGEAAAHAVGPGVQARFVGVPE